MYCAMGPDLQPAPAIVDRTAQVTHGIHIGDVKWGEGRLAAAGLDAVIQFFKPTGCLCHCDDMKFVRKLRRQSCAESTRGARDENWISHTARHGGNFAAGQGGGELLSGLHLKTARDLIGRDHGIVTAETRVAILWLCTVAVCAADCAIKPIERNEFQTVHGQMLAHFLF